jgi:hypothetical protein
MSLTTALRVVAFHAPVPALTQFQRDVDPTGVAGALAATGTATLRRRRLPAEQVLWLVLGMALYRDRSIGEVAATLDLALPGAPGRSRALPGARGRSRARVGPRRRRAR